MTVISIQVNYTADDVEYDVIYAVTYGVTNRGGQGF